MKIIQKSSPVYAQDTPVSIFGGCGDPLVVNSQICLQSHPLETSTLGIMVVMEGNLKASRT
jgi:hypothetical protein